MTFERYHIPIRIIPGRASPVPKFVITRADNCVNCGKCEKACIFGVHKRNEADFRKMSDPLSHLCKNCFRCISDCPQRALSMSIGSDYKALGRGIWTPLRISTIWGEAETGKIPVLGAGFRGMFAGPDYDGMWTDMSEIVRPTRDGIHGRESISTCADIGGKPSRLEFGESSELKTVMPPIIELSIPMLLDTSRLTYHNNAILLGCAQASRLLDSIVLVAESSITQELLDVAGRRIVPVISDGTDIKTLKLDDRVHMVELSVGSSWKMAFKNLSKSYPDVVIALRIQASKGIEDKVLEMLDADVPVIHLDYDDDGRESGRGETRHAKDSMLSIHRALVSRGARDRITIITSGGIAAAEHVPKSIICGADLVSLDKSLMVALSCRDCVDCTGSTCPASIDNSDRDWVEGRMTNLIGAWRDQMLELLGAMGIREVRRLRGEIGRAIFFEDIERDMDAILSDGEKHG
ncbi:MAG: hypothetical protein IH630_04580 [Thermoplasmata archaeon]|nr:hypothetical protein [Thermoplasmata archaeon]